MVDAALLHETFARTLVPSGEASRQAEQQLAQLEAQPHFVIALLQIIVEPQADLGVRRASAIYLKNKINRSWSPASEDVLSDTDKFEFKQQLVAAIVRTPTSLRSFLVVCLGTVLNYDYQKSQWPEFLGEVKLLLDSTDDLTRVAAGLSCFKQLCKFYRWNISSISKQLGPVMTEVYPHLLQIAEAAVNAVKSSNNDDIYYQLIYDILKIYKLSSARFLPEVFREESYAKRTTSLFLEIFVLPLPQSVIQVQPAVERTHLLPVKCQKWATVNITRTYNTYLTSSYSQLSENAAAYQPYRKMFISLFAPEITKIFVEQLQKWSTQSVWLSDAVMYNIVTFLEAMVESKQVYTELIEPQIEGLLQLVLFPLMCPTDDDLDLYEDDPIEFVQRRMDFGEVNLTPSIAATNFVQKLVRKQKPSIEKVIQFLQECSVKLQSLPDEIKGRVGLFKLVQALAFLFQRKGSVLYNQLEPFLVQYVIPDLQSKHAYLRTEACDTIERLSNTHFESRETLQQLFQSVIFCFFDQENLPLQVAAALALQSLSAQPENEDIRAAIGEHITEIIRQLLTVTQKIDSEPLLLVLDHFVEQFPDKIGPFAVNLSTQLCNQFITLASDLVEQANAFDSGNLAAESEFLIANDEKISNGLGIMNSLANLQNQLENQRELTLQLDDTIAPVFQAVYQSDFVDFYNDCFSLHENTLYTLKAVPPRHWHYFDLLVGLVQRTGFDYFDDIMPVFENYIAYGAGDLAKDPARLSNFIGLLVSMFAPISGGAGSSPASSDPASSFSDAQTRAHVMSLASRLFVSHDLFNGPLNPYLKVVVDAVLHRVAADGQSEHTFPTRYNVSTLSLILSTIYYDPNEAIGVLAGSGALNSFLETWFQTLEEFVRVNDLKLCVVASLSILNYFASHPEFQAVHVTELMRTLSHALEVLPGAVARVNEILAADQEDLWDEDDLGDELYDEEEYDGEDETLNASEAFEQEISGSLPVQSEDAQHGESIFMHENPGGAEGEASQAEQVEAKNALMSQIGFITDDFDEDVYSVSPLDSLNPYLALRTVIGGLKSQKPEFYAQLMGAVAEKDKAVMENSLQIEALPSIDKQ